MKKSLILALIASATLCFNGIVHADTSPAKKEWTFLTFLNGKNSLDSFGPTNLKQMEQVGSTDHLNVVVQWGSSTNATVKRMLIQKSADPTNVTSPVVQDLGDIDMGSWQNLRDFLIWGAKTYPAQHYFVNVWDHGGGWHTAMFNHGMKPQDISWDEETGNHITTAQLGQALREFSAAIGQKIDVYGSDACMMGMVEVGNEMSDSVTYSVGSEEVEPGAGWDYNALLTAWTSAPNPAPAEIAKYVVKTYVASYEGGSNGNEQVTMSAFDLSKLADLNARIKELGANIKAMGATDKAKVNTASNNTQRFSYNDYGDLTDFTSKLNGTGLFRDNSVSAVQAAAQAAILATDATSSYPGAHGMSIWLPDSSTYTQYSATYKTLRFDLLTDWSDALDSFNH